MTAEHFEHAICSTESCHNCEAPIHALCFKVIYEDSATYDPDVFFCPGCVDAPNYKIPSKEDIQLKILKVKAMLEVVPAPSNNV